VSENLPKATPVAQGPQVDMRVLMAANQAGVRLEVVGGLPLWEVSPAARHQKAVYRIQASIAPARDREGQCGCFSLADTYVRFPDGSLKRPDIAVFCQEPPDTDEAVTLLPEAVIEVISAGYEAKDLEIGAYFYLAQGVKDVVVFDPRTLWVLHMRRDSTRRLTSPVEIDLECGCRCQV